MKKLILLSMLMCSYILCNAQATSIIVDNQTPGWLSSKINYGDQLTLQSLKVSGFLNVDDLKFIGTLIQTHNLKKELNLHDCQIINSKGAIENIFAKNPFKLTKACNINKLVFPIKLKYSNNRLEYLYVDTLVAGGENMPIINKNIFPSGHIKNLIIREGVDSIADSAFSEEDILETIELPSSLKSIGAYAFVRCKYLTSVSIGNLISTGNSVTSIGDGAFLECHGLTSVTICNSVTSIGNNAFDTCRSLTSITIPNSVTSIGNSAFDDCHSLTSITIPNSVTSIGDSAFRGCAELGSIIVESGNSVYDSRDNCNAIIETSTNTLIEGCKSTVIPNSITRIESFAFSHRYSLTSIFIPNTVTSIGSDAFYCCHGLEYIKVLNPIPPKCISSPFMLTHYNNSLLEVPEGSLEAYRQAYAWCNFTNITGISGIEDIKVDVAEVEELGRYDIDGRLLTAPSQGINIIKMSDGSTRKVWIK